MMKKNYFLTAVFSMMLICGSMYAQTNNIQNYIETLKKDTIFQDAAVGIMVMDAKGNAVASWNPDTPLLTASTMKTITTGIALQVLGSDYKYTTTLGYTGFIKNGTLYGDLCIVGGGDPTLSSADSLGTTVDSLFSQWTEYVRNAGIHRINGSVIADDRFFEPEIIPPSWSWDNIGASYGAGTSGLNFCENLQTFALSPGDNIGDSVYLTSVFPRIPDMEYQSDLTTARTNRNSYFVSDLSRTAYFKGTIAAGENSVNIKVSNKFPHLSCALEFRDYLENNGILSNREVKCARSYGFSYPEKMNIIGETTSRPLSEIIYITNKVSQNFYAETIFKTIGKNITGHGSYDSSRVAVARVLKNMDIPLRGFRQVDGSGLSRMDQVSARFFCNYFLKMKGTDNFDHFFNSLPQPGGPGTLQSVLNKEDTREKIRIRAKSGSLANVKCYAGYVEADRGGEMLTFAILVNNYMATTAKVQTGIEEFMKQLIRYKQ